jgi:hypothetical protein
MHNATPDFHPSKTPLWRLSVRVRCWSFCRLNNIGNHDSARVTRKPYPIDDNQVKPSSNNGMSDSNDATTVNHHLELQSSRAPTNAPQQKTVIRQ